jgi:hypothetical protein
MFSIFNKTLLKYIIYVIVIFGIISYFPKNKLDSKEFLLIALPIIIVYIILDTISCSQNIFKSEKFENFQQPVKTIIEPKNTPKKTSPKNTTVSTASSGSPRSSPRSSPKSSKSSVKTTTPSTPIKKAVKEAVKTVVKNMVKKNNEMTQPSKKDIVTNKDTCGCSENKLAKKLKELEQKITSMRLYTKPEDSDLEYNQHITKNMRPLGEGLQDWKNDYIILNTDKWAPALNPPPVCKAEKVCPVCPNVQAGYAKNYTTLKDYNSSRKVMGPDNISSTYLDKLNKN